MTPRLFSGLTLGLLAACAPALASEVGGEWHLVGVDGQLATAPMSITFAADGKVNGQAPCNSFFGSYSGELPALTFSPLGATRKACADLAAESAYLMALQAVVRAEVVDGHLVLMGPKGTALEFSRSAEDKQCITCGN